MHVPKSLFKYAFKIFVCFESLDLITQFFVGKIFFYGLKLNNFGFSLLSQCLCGLFIMGPAAPRILKRLKVNVYVQYNV